MQRLCALPGIGPWTAEYVALRAFGEADAFPAADLGLLKAPVWGAAGISARELARRAEAWRPWRAYAAIYLWQSYVTGG
ncbi:DNA-3-methyladenine glycosylase 2 [compost metagenome]